VSISDSLRRLLKSEEVLPFCKIRFAKNRQEIFTKKSFFHPCTGTIGVGKKKLRGKEKKFFWGGWQITGFVKTMR